MTLFGSYLQIHDLRTSRGWLHRLWEQQWHAYRHEKQRRPRVQNQYQQRQCCKFSGPQQKACVADQLVQLSNCMVLPCTSPPFLQRCSLRGLACSWWLGLDTPGVPDGSSVLCCSVRGEINQDVERCATSDARFASYSPRYLMKDNQVIFPSSKQNKTKHPTVF